MQPTSELSNPLLTSYVNVTKRKYLTAVDYNMIKGMDDVLPITEFVKNNQDQIPPEDAAIPIKVLP